MQNKTSYKNSTFKKISLLICALLMLLTATVLLSACGDDKADTGTEGLVYSYNDEDSTATVTGYIGSITNVVIPETIDGYTVTAIGDNAFNACTTLTIVVISDSIVEIGESSFASCVKLEDVEFGNFVETIGNYAFSGCIKLLTIEIPDSVTSIGEYTFANLNLTNVTIGNGVKNIGERAFYKCDDLTTLIMGSSVETIGSYAFYNCSALSELTIPESAVSIGEYAFSNCQSLNSITIYKNVTILGNGAFYNCVGLTEINYNAKNLDNLQEGNDVFYNAGKNNEEVTLNIGSSVEKLPSCLFYTDSTCITTIVFEDNSNCQYIGDNAFYNCSQIANVYVEDVSTWLNISFESIGSNPLYNWANLYYKQNESYKMLLNLIIPDTISTINDYAFCGCFSLQSVTISDSVVGLGNYAFYKCPLISSLTIGTGIEYISNFCFSYCTYLKSVVIPDNVLSIGMLSFRECFSISSLTIGNGVQIIDSNAFYNCTGLTSLIIGSAVENIGSKAFYGCTELPEITIPENVKTIGKYAFYGCSKLTSVTFETTSGWSANSTTFPSTDLAKAVTAASYLTSTYYEYSWTRN